MKKFINNLKLSFYIALGKLSMVPLSVLKTHPLDSLPIALQRVLIAKDVIAQVKCGFYFPSQDRYVKRILMKNMRDASDECPLDDIKSNFQNIEECEVCALGACVLSLTKFKNTLRFQDVTSPYEWKYNTPTTKMLSTFFNATQLLLIEVAFEGIYTGPTFNIGRDVANADEQDAFLPWYIGRAKDFYVRFPLNDVRLIKIMENIVENNGTFIP